MIRHLYKFLFLLLATQLQAAYIGNPKDPALIEKGLFSSKHSIVSVQTSLIDDWIIDRKLEGLYTLKNKSFSRNVGGLEVAIDLLHRANFFSYFGASSTNIEFQNSSGLTTTYDTKEGLAVNYGVRVIVCNIGKFCLGASGKHQLSSSNIVSNWPLRSGLIIDQSESFIKAKELQGSLLASYSFPFLTPYLGWFYSDLDYNIYEVFTNSELQSNTPLTNANKNGIALGLSVTSGDYFSLTLETRFIAETACSAQLSAKF